MATTLVEMWTIEALEKHHAKCHTGSSTGLIPMNNILFPVPYSKDQDKATATVLYLTKSIAKLEKKLLLTCSMSLQQKFLSYTTHVFFENKASEHEKRIVSMVQVNIY